MVNFNLISFTGIKMIDGLNVECRTTVGKEDDVT